MLAAALLAGTLALGPGPGLAPEDEPAPPSQAPSGEAPPAPETGGSFISWMLGLGAVAAALAAARPSGFLELRPPPLVVFVPGHGQGPAEEVFADFVAIMGLGAEEARYFDYRWVTGESSAQAASQHAPIGPTARSLNAYLAGLAEEDRAIWLVGFSKGGATIAELVGAWDRGAYQPPDVEVTGALLLDPPISDGFLGTLQSAGRHVGPLPDDGGYNPVDCAFLHFGCHDSRVGLGDASGVDVLVVRNPRAGVTSFYDHPAGLRVYEAPDAGPGPWGQVARNPLRLPARLSQAHESVLSDPAVVRCFVMEMRRHGTCQLEVEPEGLPFLRKLVGAKAAVYR